MRGSSPPSRASTTTTSEGGGSSPAPSPRSSNSSDRTRHNPRGPHRTPARSAMVARLRDVCVVAGCFGLLSVQLFSSLTLMGLKHAVEDATRPANEQLRQREGVPGPVATTTARTVRRASSSSSSTDSKQAVRGQRLPTCNCPQTCSFSVLSKRRLAGNQTTSESSNNNGGSCLERIVHHQQTGQLGELQSCVMAVEEGFCGMECHPTKCGGVAADPAAAPKGGEGKSAQKKETPPVTVDAKKNPVAKKNEESAAVLSSINPMPWNRMQHLEPPPQRFQRYDNVVVATKIMGPDHLAELKQMFCLFMAAYNRHVNYDIVVFTTLPWDDKSIQELRDVVGPNVNLTVALEAKPLAEQVEDMSVEERNYIFQRCRVPHDGQLTYYHWCLEEPNGTDKPFYDVRLSYAWQAEFRAKHVWHAPVLEPYKYMLWIDSDAFCMRPWAVDPIKVMIENDLVILFDNFPGDSADNPILKQKMMRAYNRTLCELNLVDGHFQGRACDEAEMNDPKYWLRVVHGFFHVTNLDFYRSPSVTNFLDIMLGGKRFSREWDDQLAVTVPAAMEAPERSWDMRANGLHLQVWHNGNIDGKLDERPTSHDDFVPYWNETARSKWDFGRDVCERYIVSNG